MQNDENDELYKAMLDDMGADLDTLRAMLQFFAERKAAAGDMSRAKALLGLAAADDVALSRFQALFRADTERERLTGPTN